jgi:von Willebrand factor type A domain
MRLFEGLSSGGNQGYLVLFNQRVAMSNGPTPVSIAQTALQNVQFQGGTAIYDAIDDVCAQKLSRSQSRDIPRRVIVLVSDGDDNASHISRAKVEETAQREGVAVFSLVTGAYLTEPPGEQFLQEIGQTTGGQSIKGKNMTEDVTRLLNVIERQWALSLIPAQPLGQKSASLSVKSTQKDVRLSTPARIFQ